jgi:uncharacterized protein (TIGR00290 family)
MKPKTLLSWSSGKDSAWALHTLRQQDQFEVVGLVTTFNEAADRVAMHAVRRELAEAQARAVGLPLWPVWLPSPCSNVEYERRMAEMLTIARQQGITHMAFGDLFLQDIRTYRERQLAETGITPVFPLWCTDADTPLLARQMIAAGLRAVVTCVDPRQCDPALAGTEFSAEFLDNLPGSVDPCGERGEFHTFCWAGPIFHQALPVRIGKRVDRNGFCFVDVQ